MATKFKEICDKALSISQCLEDQEILSVGIGASKIQIHLDRMQDFAEIQDFLEYETEENHGYIHHKKIIGKIECIALEKIKGDINE